MSTAKLAIILLFTGNFLRYFWFNFLQKIAIEKLSMETPILFGMPVVWYRFRLNRRKLINFYCAS